MIKTIIVEDDNGEAAVLEGYLVDYGKEVGEQISVKRYSSADAFLMEYGTGELADVIFMDIEMPGIDGMTCAKKLRERDGEVFLIFVTRIAKYAVHGYSVDALDYFLKPVRYRDLRMRMERIRRMKGIGDSVIKISVAGGFKVLNVKDVLYVESDNHTLIYHTDDGCFTGRGMSMRQAEQEYAKYGFARCNVCYLVNVGKCRSVDGSMLTVGDDVIQISRAKRKQFLSALKNSWTAGVNVCGKSTQD